MGTLERPADRGRAAGDALVRRLGSELRVARQDRGLSLAVVAGAAGMSASELSRLERGQRRSVGLAALSTVAAVVGLELSVRAFPAGEPVRDRAHLALLASFRALLHPSLTWRTEVPLPMPGDRRAWDGVVSGRRWRYGVEAETGPRDSQALNRRVRLKLRDSDLDGVLLVLRSTEQTRRFLREAGLYLGPNFPVDGRAALARLRNGDDPGGSAIIVL